ncbi:MAG: hypothetical protein LBC27_09785 [Spirochaetaceae bacterium]|jgi:hypothetical protein|nr:hypothetical protein [Spirochaetaceae bacterium]
MSKDFYVGVEDLARTASKLYVGVGGIARKAIRGYIGDTSGKARLFFGTPEPLEVIIVTPNTMTADNAPTPYVAKANSTFGMNSGNSGWVNAYKAFRLYENSDSTYYYTERDTPGSTGIPGRAHINYPESEAKED